LSVIYLMPIRTKEDKEQRKIMEANKTEEYRIFYGNNQNLIQECKLCHDKKPLNEFVSNYSFRFRCKKCHRTKTYRWRNENKPAFIEIRQRRGKRSAAFIRSLKEGKSCCQCEKPFPPHVLDFHHLFDKEWTISQLYGKSHDRILKEIGKCQLLCANCHRDTTQNEISKIPILKNRYYASALTDTEINIGDATKLCIKCNKTKHINDFTLLKIGKRFTYCRMCMREYNTTLSKNRKNRAAKETVRNEKDMAVCVDCGNKFHYWIFDTDHIGEDKIGNINILQNGSIHEVKDELNKCDIICVNCHRKRTWQWRKNSEPCICGFKPRSASEKSKHIKDCPLQEKPIINESEVDTFIQKIESFRTNNLEESHAILDKYHYAKFGRSAYVVYKALYDNEIVAIVKFATPVRKEVATSLGWNYSEVLELDRFCILPKFQVKNLASKVMAQVIKLVKSDFPHIVLLVSFVDPEQGHIGTIYKASNWTYIGTTANSYTYIDEKGDEINKKTIYNRAISNNMKEKEYAEKMNLSKVKIGVKDKYGYELN